MGHKWILVLLGAIALLHYTVGEEEFPENEEEVELVEGHVRVRRQSPCSDTLGYCSQWPDKYCTFYKEYMKKNCARKCGYCNGPTQAPVCIDKSQNCAGWKSSGFCDKDSQYHNYMKSNCAKTCRFCGGDGGGGSGGDCSGAASNKIRACSFDSDTCDWSNVPFDDQADFTVTTSGSAGGPTSGHGGSGGYLVAKGSAQLLLPLEIILPHDNTATKQMCLRFQYAVPGGSLKLYQIENRKGQPTRTLKTISGDSSTGWKCGKQTVNVSTKYQLMIEATVNSGVVAIDEVSFADGAC